MAAVSLPAITTGINDVEMNDDVRPPLAQVTTFSAKDWERAGTINSLMSSSLIIDEDPHICDQEENQLAETLRCERLLRRFMRVTGGSAPTFINLSFAEISYQAVQDNRVVLAAIVVEDRSVGSLARLLHGVEEKESVYFWVAEAWTKSGQLVKSKLGSGGGSELLILAPTKSVGNPVLVERYSGHTLTEENHGSVREAILRAKSALHSLRLEWEMIQEDRLIMRQQEAELERSLTLDRQKTVMKERSKRLEEEPDSDYWEIRVQLGDGKNESRKFRQGSKFQAVYDWIGVTTGLENFTLQRPGAGFIGTLCKHGDDLEGPETLLCVVRDASETSEMLSNEVSFYGDYPMEPNLSKTLEDNKAEDKNKKMNDDPEKDQELNKKMNDEPEKDQEEPETGTTEKKKRKRKRRKNNQESDA
ncbi:uncharacterized protein LOC144665727 [Oculina patagonica]